MSLKPSSITSFFAAKHSTIIKKRKPEAIEIDADEIPERIMIETTEKDGRLVNIEVCYNEAVRQRRDYKEKPKPRAREKA